MEIQTVDNIYSNSAKNKKIKILFKAEVISVLIWVGYRQHGVVGDVYYGTYFAQVYYAYVHVWTDK